LATYLVLGSAGQIGAPLVQYLNSKGEDVLKFDIKDGPEFDLRTRSDLLDSAIAKSDFVIFLAYDVGGSKYLQMHQNSAQFMQNNMKIMNTVFPLLHDKQFIFVSSQLSQYTSSAYGALKNVGAHYTRALGGMVAKLYNVYGVEEADEKAHVITDFITQARDNKAIRVRTNGLETRQFLHATDCARAFHLLSKNYSNSTVDITSFVWTSVFEVAMIVSDLFGKVPVYFADKAADQLPGEPIMPCDDILKIWRPTIALEAGILAIKEKLCG